MGDLQRLKVDGRFLERHYIEDNNNLNKNTKYSLSFDKHIPDHKLSADQYTQSLVATTVSLSTRLVTENMKSLFALLVMFECNNL